MEVINNREKKFLFSGIGLSLPDFSLTFSFWLVKAWPLITWSTSGVWKIINSLSWSIFKKRNSLSWSLTHKLAYINYYWTRNITPDFNASFCQAHTEFFTGMISWGTLLLLEFFSVLLLSIWTPEIKWLYQWWGEITMDCKIEVVKYYKIDRLTGL